MKTALVCITKNCPNLKEWAEWHSPLFDDVHVFLDEEDPVPGMPDNVLQKRICVPPTLVKQLELYNAFVKLNGFEYDWTMMLDDDEYLVLRGSGCRTLGEYAEKQAWYVSAFPWVYYGGRENPDRAGDRSTLLRRFQRRGKAVTAGEVKIAFASKNSGRRTNRSSSSTRIS